MNYLDANFAVAVHFTVLRQTDVAAKFVRKNSDPFIFSELTELECRRAFLLLSGRANSENWARLQAMIAVGMWRRDKIDWEPLLEKANQLVDRFGTTLKAGTLDTLHVAHALLAGCSRFLSFDNDSNARALAAACRLKVFPDLSAAERGRVRIAAQKR